MENSEKTVTDDTGSRIFIRTCAGKNYGLICNYESGEILEKILDGGDLKIYDQGKIEIDDVIELVKKYDVDLDEIDGQDADNWFD